MVFHYRRTKHVFLSRAFIKTHLLSFIRLFTLQTLHFAFVVIRILWEREVLISRNESQIYVFANVSIGSVGQETVVPGKSRKIKWVVRSNASWHPLDNFCIHYWTLHCSRLSTDNGRQKLLSVELFCTVSRNTGCQVANARRTDKHVPYLVKAS